jgi:hypothetical protein
MYRRMRALIFSRCFSVFASANSRMDDITVFLTTHRSRTLLDLTEFIGFFLRFGMARSLKRIDLEKDSPTGGLTRQDKYETH